MRVIISVCLHGLLLVGAITASRETGSELFEEVQSILTQKDARHSDQVRAKEMLEEVLQNQSDHTEALYAMGEIYQLGKGVDQDLEQSFEFFLQAAQLGHPPSQEEVGLLYSAGLGTKVDTPRALLYLYFASAANQTRAQLALGYRHMYGFSVPKSCQAAVMYYSQAAQDVISSARGHGNHPSIEKIRLSIDHDSNYNPGREQDMVQYYQYSADMGNTDAQTAIGQLFNFGARGMEQDYEQALHYFMQASQAGDGDAAAHLGHMYANGLGVEADNATALEYFRKGAEKGHPHAMYGLGYMYLTGSGLEKNLKKAHQYFSQAATDGSPDAQFHLGVMALQGMLSAPDYGKAFHHFNTASHQGHLLAIYNLAMMQLGGVGVPVSCKNALQLMKSVSERGPWSQLIEEAHSNYLSGNAAVATTLYLKAAEMGLELGQSNGAWLLDRRARRGRGKVVAVTWCLQEDGEEKWHKRALHYHELAADQGNTNSLLQIGDAHYYGKGTPEDIPKSVAIYRQRRTVFFPR
ncbi:hypothetical protein CYMTET_18412 [Cymbomonas tetramitiformis]|uniref:Uncharacterized protein n=1 Tax=Cymbomonas tetramitiformis TaxID=36881 RepID=A0AAE0L5X3_9CHLO|nr:hypothetical protein CYMTET_18412 [Cymbomonas tetramitiformis]